MKAGRSIIIPVFLLFYLLGIHDDRIALWDSDDPEPVKIFPYSAASFPPAVQEALRHGIPIASWEDIAGRTSRRCQKSP